MWSGLRLRLLRSGGVALVTTDWVKLQGHDNDLELLVAALDRLRIRAECPIWHDPTVRWSDFDLVVLRSPWDYTYRLGQFLAWLDQAADHVPVLNCPHTIRWNLDKGYLLALEAAGIPVIPTRVVGTPEEIGPGLADLDSDAVVVKPLVGAGARHTGLFQAGDPEARLLAERIVASGSKVALQPAIPSVATIGERALVFLDGEFSHAVTKGPILAMGGGLAGGAYRETISACEPSEAEVALAASCLDGVQNQITSSGCDCRPAPPLYARFDLVESSRGPLLLEAELFEPSLFVDSSSQSAALFAEAVAQRLTGPGA